MRLRALLALIAAISFWLGDNGSFSGAPVSADEVEPDETTAEELTSTGIVDAARLDEFVSAYREQRAELTRLDADAYPLATVPEGMLLAFDSPGFVNAYLGGDEKQVRVFVMRMRLANTSEVPLTLNAQDVVLDEDGKPIAYQALDGRLTSYSVNVGDGYPSLSALEVAPEVTLPAGGLASSWLVFQGLDHGNHVPSLSLKVPDGDHHLMVDLNDYFHALLKVRMERIGPKDCLALMTIHGEATCLGLGALVGVVDELSAAGLSRLMVEWAADAKPIDQSIRNTFFHSVAQHGREHYSDEERFLALPTAIMELAVVLPTDKSFETVSYSNDGTARFFRWPGEAATQVLASAFELTSDDDLFDEIDRGHDYSKIAAMRLAGTRLSSEHLPLLLTYTQGSDERFRHAALVALSYVDHPLAVEELLKTARATADGKTAQQAISSLLLSPHPRMQAQVETLLTEENLDVRQLAMKMISSHPQARWREQIAELLDSPIVDVRVQAFKALSQIGHPELTAILLRHLTHEEAKIRREAFLQLSAIDDPKLVPVLTSFCLENIKARPTDSKLLDFIVRYKPHEALAPLTELFSQTKANRSQLISALLSLGDHDTFELLVNASEELTRHEERDALLSIGDVSVPHYQRLVKKMLDGYTPDTKINLNHLMNEIYRHADGETIETLIAFLKRWERDPRADSDGELRSFLQQTINAIGQVANTRSRQFLAEFVVQTDNDFLREQSLEAINNSFQSSPGYNISHQTEQYLNKKNYTKALKIANIAIEHDSESPQAYAIRGDCYFHQAEIEKAISDYSRALALNPGIHDVLLKRSDCYLIQKNPVLAEQDLLLALRLRTNRIDATESLGQLYRRTGQIDKALPLLKKTVELSPKSLRGITAAATILLLEANPGAAGEYLDRHADNQTSLPFQYTSAAIYAAASRLLLADQDQTNDAQATAYRAKSLELLKKLDASGSSKIKLISSDPAFVGLDTLEGFQPLFEKHGKSLVNEGAVGTLSPAKSSSYSASIEVGPAENGSPVQQALFEAPKNDESDDEEVKEKPQLVSGEVLLLAPPE